MTPTSRADLILVGVTLLAAVSWIMSREAVLLMPPLLFMCLRFLLAAALLVVFGWPMLRRLTLSAWRRSVGVGLVFALGMSCWVMGIFTGTHVGEGAFLTSLGVVLVPVMGKLFFHEQPPRSTWMALPVAIMGLALLSLRHGFRPEAGQMFYLTSAFIFAWFFRLNMQAATERYRVGQDGRQVVEAGVPAIALTTIVLAMVGLCAGVLSWLFEAWQPTLSHFSPVLAGWVVASAVIGTALRFLLQTYAQSLSHHTHGVVLMVLEPVWVAILAAMWLDESMSMQQVAGCALIFGSLLINRAAVIRDFLMSINRP